MKPQSTTLTKTAVDSADCSSTIVMRWCASIAGQVRSSFLNGYLNFKYFSYYAEDIRATTSLKVRKNAETVQKL